MAASDENLSFLENKVQKLENKLKEHLSNNPKRTSKSPGLGNSTQQNQQITNLPVHTPPQAANHKNEALEKPMSFQEKKSLTMMIKNLHTNHLKGVWQIVCNDNPSLSMKKELVIDIERLPTRTARELEKYVKGKISNSQKTGKKKQKKNQLGFSEEEKGPIGYMPERAETAPVNNNPYNNQGGSMPPGPNPNMPLGMHTGQDSQGMMARNQAMPSYDNYGGIPQNVNMSAQEEKIAGSGGNDGPAPEGDGQSSDSSFFTDIDSDEEK